MKKEKRIICLILAVMFVLCSGIWYLRTRRKSSPAADCLTVSFFDVGQADCSLLVFPDGVTVLIDSGNRADGRLIAAKLRCLGIDKIDHFILTHPHEDHIGGAPDVFERFKILNVYLPGIDSSLLPDTEVYKQLCTAIKKEGCETHYCTVGMSLFEGERYSAKALAPSDGAVFSNLNDYSLAVRVEYGQISLLFAGDAGKASDSEMLRSGELLKADIMKVAHHGGSDGAGAEFLDAVRPKAAVISCGRDNEYGHPHGETLKALTEIGAKCYRTDLSGTVTVEVETDKFTVRTSKNTRLDGDPK